MQCSGRSVTLAWNISNIGSCLALSGAVVAVVDGYLDLGLRGFQFCRGWSRHLLGGCLELGIVERRLDVGLGVEGAVPEEYDPLFTVFACAVQGEDGIG